MIILLDIDHVLRGMIDHRPRTWLIDMLRDHHVIALSDMDAAKGEQAILDFAAEADWRPTEAHFNPTGAAPAESRLDALRGAVWPSHGRKARYVAIETDIAALAMFRQHGIMAAPPAMFEGHVSIIDALERIYRIEAQRPKSARGSKTSTLQVSATNGSCGSTGEEGPPPVDGSTRSP